MYGAICVVALVVAATARRRERLLALPLTLVSTALAVVHLTVPTAADPGKWTSWTGSFSALHPIRDSLALLLLAGTGLVVLAWGAGFGIGAATRLRRLDSVLADTEGRLAETDLELRLGQERSRISRDVHDSVAHALTIVVAQSEGGAALHRRDPDVVDVVLEAISGVAREALADVRGLVERITEPGDELLSLEDVPALAERMRGVGMAVTLDELGERPELRAAQQLTVYRLVQESLTNALKHGGQASRASVVLDWRGGGLALMVHSSGGAPLVARGSLPGAGAGITGMTERAAISGGWLTAGPDESGDFVVTASLPFGQGPAAAAPDELAATVPGGSAARG
nr:histidine kinase [Frigoribacterium faeni]